MKLLLLQPPIQDFYETDIRLQPIGLCYLKAAVKKFLPEINVVIKDYHQGWGRRTIPIPRELAYLKEFYPVQDKSPFSSFYHYYHFGAPFEVLAEEVAREKPDLVGISSLFSPYYREVLQCAEEIKKRIPVSILAGGSHVSACPEQMLAHPAIDFIIRGEGEKPLVEFLKAWIAGQSFENVSNLGFKKEGQLILNSLQENYEFEKLPHPDLSDLSPAAYLYERRPLSFVITSRSCPHRCTFCSVHKTFGLRFRRRTSADVLQEIITRYQEGYRVFDFEDDNLTYYKDEMKQLCLDLIELFPEKDVEFVAMNGISYLSLDTELLRLMKEAGFTHLNLALVTSDTTVRETTKRPHTIEKYLEVVHEATRLGFEIVSYQILGLPNESLESMIQTLVFNARLPVLLGASMFYLTPNSPIAQGFPEPSDEDIFKSRLTAMAIETGDFKREDLYTLFITTRIINFFKGLSLSGDTNFEECLEAAKKIDHRSRLGAEIFERLMKERALYAATAQGLVPLPKFKAELFFHVWKRLDCIGTQTGKTVSVLTGDPHTLIQTCP
ncbi:MAG: B12-binding domain-containing radical SAM protein [Candidatus Omnitrophica bacterium]|nr:B12-binding domain-containing radical SAM protein [Candidatus Omnitrophota bacterium]